MQHKYSIPGTYNVTVKFTNPVTDDPVYEWKEIIVENPVRRDDYHIETEVTNNPNGSRCPTLPNNIHNVGYDASCPM